MNLLQILFAQDEKDEKEICLTMSKTIVYKDIHLKGVKKCTEITKSSESFQKLRESYDRSISLSTSINVGIEGFDIGNAPSVSFAWTTTNEKEFSNKNFFQSKQLEEIEYSKTSRQLFKEETVKFEISRKLKGRTVKSSIAESFQSDYKHSIPTAPELGCAQPKQHRLYQIATAEIKKMKAKFAPNATVTGLFDDTLSETHCGDDREYIIDFLLPQILRISRNRNSLSMIL